MTPLEYTQAISRLGLSQRASARFFGVDERTVRRWIKGERRIPKSVELLAGLMLRSRLDPPDIEILFQMPLESPAEPADASSDAPVSDSATPQETSP